MYAGRFVDSPLQRIMRRSQKSVGKPSSGDNNSLNATVQTGSASQWHLSGFGGFDHFIQMTMMFELSFHGTNFIIQKGKIINLFENHPDLITSSCYNVQSNVPIEIFEIFVKTLETGTKVSVTNGNVDSLILLAEEFCLQELIAECSILRASLIPESKCTFHQIITQNEFQTVVMLELKEILRSSIGNHRFFSPQKICRDFLGQ
jgi:hypothetical protein